MSDQTGYEEFDAYLHGTSRLSKVYATLDKPLPPAALDEAVMNQASQALDNSREPRRWMVPASLAAVLLLSFTVVMRVVLGPLGPEADPEDGKPGRDILPRPSVENARPSLPAGAAPATPAADSPVQRPALTVQPRIRVQQRSPATRFENIEPLMPAQKSAGEVARDPGTWLEEIEALANDGDLEGAEAELERFRSTYPEHSVGSELQRLSR